MKSFRPKAVERGELIVCIVASLVAIWLHGVLLTHAGALWRDEAGSITFATLLPFGEMCHKLAYEAFPICYPALVRVWSALGLGGSDFSLRLLGFLAGMGLLGAVWVNARLMGSRWPVITLALLGANMTVVRWGDCLRAYGLGSLFILLTLGLTWRLVRAPSRESFLAAALAAVLSVQTLYQNSFLVLAGCLAGCVLCARRRQWKSIALVLAVGFSAALSLLPYVPGIHASNQSFRMIEKTGFDAGWVWFNIGLATGSPYDWQMAVWVIVIALAGAAGLVSGWRQKAADWDLHLFAATAMLLAIALFMFFIWLTALPSQVWYYLPLLVFVAACANAALPPIPTGTHSTALFPWLPYVGAGFAAFMVLVSIAKADESARVRATNLDQVAAYLTAKAEPGDVIVIHPWYCGATFQRYYRGKAQWFTVPPMSDHRYPRFDLLLADMLGDDPMPPVVRSCTTALTSGHKVWMLGWFEFNGGEPPVLPKPPNGRQGWNEVPYEDAWAGQISYLAAHRAAELDAVPDDRHDAISPYEDLKLYYASGWRTNSSSSVHP
jgi:hypothetical protein